MAPIDVTFDIPAKIAAGLADNTLVRNGGVVQDDAGRVVMWLREVSGNQQIGAISPTGGTSGAMSLMGAGSMLTLGISVLGFTAIYAKVKELEGRLQEVQKVLEVIDKKIDISFYANFRAALDLARNSFSMTEESNRHNSALQAINRFLEAEHTYADLLDKELESQSSACGEYLLTLCLAYLAEVRCYLELGEYATALRRFQESKTQIQKYVEAYIGVLLTDDPAIYLHPKLSDSINLSRLTRIFQWADPSLNESLVFEYMRNSLVYSLNLFIEDKIKNLPQSVIEPWKVKKGFWGIADEGTQAVFERLPQVVSEMESIIETSSRFAAYEYELNLLRKSKITLKQWETLKPKQLTPEGIDIMYIIPPSPIMLESISETITS